MTDGYVANLTRLFAYRPEVYRAWRELNSAIKANMDLRRYELATLAAAQRLGSSYGALAHGQVLRDRVYDAETVRAIACERDNANLDPVDVAVMDFSDRVAGGANAVTATASPSSARTASPTPTSSTSPSPPAPAASSAPSSTPWASSPTPPTAPCSNPSCAKPSPPAARVALAEAATPSSR